MLFQAAKATFVQRNSWSSYNKSIVPGRTAISRTTRVHNIHRISKYMSSSGSSTLKFNPKYYCFIHILGIEIDRDNILILPLKRNSDPFFLWLPLRTCFKFTLSLLAMLAYHTNSTHITFHIIC